MADIYNQRGVMDTVPDSYHHQGNPAVQGVKYGLQLQKQADERAIKAKQIYDMGMAALSQQSMEELYRQYGNQPDQLATELAGVKEKLASNIPDDETRIKFGVNFDFKANSYINQAKSNYEKAEYKRYKSGLFDNIVANIQVAGLSYANLVGTTATADDVLNFNRASVQTEQMIDAMNSDGTYMFSDYDRQRMRDDLDQSKLNALKIYYTNMLPYEQRQFEDELSRNVLTIGGRVDDDGKIVRISVIDTISENNYQKLKNFVSAAAKKKKKLFGTMNDQEASQLSAVQTMNKINADDTWDQIKKDSKDKKYTQNGITMKILEHRVNLFNMAQSGELDADDYKKSVQKTIVPLVDAAEKSAIESSEGWLGNKTAFNKGVDYFQERWNYLSKEERAYIYTELYKRMIAAGIDPNAPKNDVADRVREVAQKLERDFVEDKAANVIGVKKAKVLIGDDLVDYGE